MKQSLRCLCLTFILLCLFKKNVMRTRNVNMVYFSRGSFTITFSCWHRGRRTPSCILHPAAYSWQKVDSANFYLFHCAWKIRIHWETIVLIVIPFSLTLIKNSLSIIKLYKKYINLEVGIQYFCFVFTTPFKMERMNLFINFRSRWF